MGEGREKDIIRGFETAKHAMDGWTDEVSRTQQTSKKSGRNN